MDDFKVFPEQFQGPMRYAGAHPADADTVVFCYSSGAVSGTPRPDQLAQQYLDAARKYGVASGLCVFAIDFPIDEVPRDHGVSVADVVSDAVRAVARHNSTAARIVSCVDSPSHHHEVARSADRGQYPIDHSIVVSHDIAALL